MCEVVAARKEKFRCVWVTALGGGRISRLLCCAGAKGGCGAARKRASGFWQPTGTPVPEQDKHQGCAEEN